MPAKLGYYDAVMIYGDRIALTPAQAKALDRVRRGRSRPRGASWRR